MTRPVSMLAGRLVAGLAAACLLASSGAVAQSGAPVQVEADTIDYRPAERLALLTGNAVVVQAGMVLRSNALRIIYSAAGNQRIERVVADQEVFFSRGDQRVRGDRCVLDANANTITITGNVVVTQGRNVLQGQQLVVNTATNASTMRGNDGRVRAVFFQD